MHFAVPSAAINNTLKSIQTLASERTKNRGVIDMTSTFEILTEYYGSDGFYPYESDSEECADWQEYSRKLGGIEVTVDDIHRAQAKEQAKYEKFVLPQSFKTARQQRIEDFCFMLFCRQFGIEKFVKRRQTIELRRGQRLIRYTRFV